MDFLSNVNDRIFFQIIFLGPHLTPLHHRFIYHCSLFNLRTKADQIRDPGEQDIHSLSPASNFDWMDESDSHDEENVSLFDRFFGFVRHQNLEIQKLKWNTEPPVYPKIDIQAPLCLDNAIYICIYTGYISGWYRCLLCVDECISSMCLLWIFLLKLTH
mgnify:CR=1 FL=1